MLSEPIFEIGPFKFHMYGFMVAVGVAAALFILYYFGKKKNVSEKFLDFVFYNTLAAVLGGFGSAALFQATYNYIENPEYGFDLSSGITFIGGLIGGVVVFLAVYFILRPRLDGRLTQMIGIIPCAITAGHGFGRIGCFFAGCCYGNKTDSIFGVVFPAYGCPDYPVHPTQLYEAFFLFLICGICAYLVMKKNFHYTFCIYLSTYGVFRFFLEFVRGDRRGKFLFGITPSQFWSIVMIFAAVGVYFILKNAFAKAEKEALNATKNKDDEEDETVVSIFSSDDE